jgi:hypothetical protein
LLWPARDHLSSDASDFFGVMRLEGIEYRLRAWRGKDRDAISVRVKL